jgi:hypothetical protein
LYGVDLNLLDTLLHRKDTTKDTEFDVVDKKQQQLLLLAHALKCVETDLMVGSNHMLQN